MNGFRQSEREWMSPEEAHAVIELASRHQQEAGTPRVSLREVAQAVNLEEPEVARLLAEVRALDSSRPSPLDSLDFKLKMAFLASSALTLAAWRIGGSYPTPAFQLFLWITLTSGFGMIVTVTWRMARFLKAAIVPWFARHYQR